jgi:hypothetical protein
MFSRLWKSSTLDGQTPALPVDFIGTVLKIFTLVRNRKTPAKPAGCAQGDAGIDAGVPV